ncbi:MAG: hypothetical protein LBU22_14470 [Dysgonamonadaceae bacterium]|jgi:hypothetical protein|nr:hypothetical protein [Dysgonamonadaceae bacterium]
MNKKTVKLNDLAKVNAFRVPEGYFEGLTADIMSQLPERIPGKPKTVSLWHKVQPWAYMAAMFVGIALIVRIFVGAPRQTGINGYASEGLNLSSPSDIEDFYNYYEDGLAKIAYDDATFSLANYSEGF